MSSGSADGPAPSTAAPMMVDVNVTDTSQAQDPNVQGSLPIGTQQESNQQILATQLRTLLGAGSQQVHAFKAFEKLSYLLQDESVKDVVAPVITALEETEEDFIQKVDSVTSNDAQINPGNVKAVIRDMANRMSSILLFVGVLGSKMRQELDTSKAEAEKHEVATKRAALLA